MSSTEEKADLKAGHPPAVKAGGMRVATRPRHTSTGDKKEAPVQDGEEEEFPESASPPKAERHNQQMLVSGAVTKGDRDFTEAAVKQIHEKPNVGKEKRPMNTSHRIQQPQ
ncbi:Death-associated protein 1 [Lamellibrachia satsuma]|nr:Death-associated protein 1 [Lamellibrachia satsuma]